MYTMNMCSFTTRSPKLDVTKLYYLPMVIDSCEIVSLVWFQLIFSDPQLCWNHNYTLKIQSMFPLKVERMLYINHFLF